MPSFSNCLRRCYKFSTFFQLAGVGAPRCPQKHHSAPRNEIA